MAPRLSCHSLILLFIFSNLILIIMAPLTLSHSSAAGLLLGVFQLARPSFGAIDADWYPPSPRAVNNLTEAIEAKGVYGYIYDTSETPDEKYGTYNWCNMPHVRKREYVPAEKGYELRYVELVSLTYYEAAR
jgi:hypothetical protein